MVFQGWRERIRAATTAKTTGVASEISASLASTSAFPEPTWPSRSAPEGTSARHTVSPYSDQARRAAAWRPLPPSPSSRSSVRCVTTPLYRRSVFQSLRRSLRSAGRENFGEPPRAEVPGTSNDLRSYRGPRVPVFRLPPRPPGVPPRPQSPPRSEEHTSELQSRQYLVCRLLLEKKKYINPCTLLYI